MRPSSSIANGEMVRWHGHDYGSALPLLQTEGDGLSYSFEDLQLKGVVSSRILTGYAQLVRQLGGNPIRLIEDCVLQTGILTGEIEQIPLRSVAKLLELSASCLGCEDFGRKLAGCQDRQVNMIAPLDGLVRNAVSLSDMFAYLSTYLHTFTTGYKLTRFNKSEELTALGIDIADDTLPPAPQLMEQLLLHTHQAAVHLTDGFAQTREVWFSHLRIGSQPSYRESFGTIVKFNQEYDAVFYRSEDLGMPIVGSDRWILRREAEAVASLFPAAPDCLENRVRFLLKTLIPQGMFGREEVAKLLNLSSRTLRRKLKGSGTPFELLRDEARRSMTLRYLSRTDLPFNEIAARLGYSEGSVLSRSCRRWFNVSPSTLRRELQHQA